MGDEGETGIWEERGKLHVPSITFDPSKEEDVVRAFQLAREVALWATFKTWPGAVLDPPARTYERKG